MSKELMDENLTKSDRLIHTPSSYARKNLIFAQETGTLKSLKEHICVRENLESYLFFIVLDGCGVVSTGGKDYEAKKGDAVLLDCRKHYEHKSDVSDPWEIRWVHFNGELPERLFEVFVEGNTGSPVFTPNDNTCYIDVLDRLNDMLAKSNVIAEINQSSLLEQLFMLCLNDVVGDRDLSFDDNTDMDEDEFSTLRESVNEHINEGNLERILSIQYGLQENKLSELFEKKYGISLSDYILNRKLNKAKELLRFTIKSLDEIISEAGFESEDLFRKLFMESEEMSPEDYRKKWAQWIKS